VTAIWDCTRRKQRHFASELGHALGPFQGVPGLAAAGVSTAPCPRCSTDLQVRGMLDETLVVCLSEMGRTPKINGRAGRDHWVGTYPAPLRRRGRPGGRSSGAPIGLADSSPTAPSRRRTCWHGVSPVRHPRRRRQSWTICAGRCRCTGKECRSEPSWRDRVSGSSLHQGLSSRTTGGRGWSLRKPRKIAPIVAVPPGLSRGTPAPATPTPFPSSIVSFLAASSIATKIVRQDGSPESSYRINFS